MATIELKDIRKSFGPVDVIKGVDIHIEDGEFAVFVGPSGCGKSTLLRLIAGLESINSGEFLLDGKVMNEIAPDKRGIAMVFQSYALYPHMTVAQNIGFSLDLKKVSKEKIRREVEEVAEKLQLSDLLDRRPAALSGGQRQRVAIGRAIIKKPSVILFDEPLSNLDASLRVQMRAELQRLHQELSATVIYVTHDQVEAMTMADRIVVLKDGEVAQCAPPIELYKKPANTFVGTFIGSPRMNLLPATIDRSGSSAVEARVDNGWVFKLPESLAAADGDRVQVGVRPEHLRISNQPGAITTNVSVVERLGVETYLTLGSSDEPIIARVDGDITARIGDQVHLSVDEKACHLFDTTGKSINYN
ncbi:sn-glycerol-3-phosphate ABC transporter ATP-binding protein UgpC [Roseibium sp. SCPC15]|uniref:ABC transporter ATP-binding protein n=1 Tax=Roseibium sp. SCP15 TaxID=3141376 RepID=UPI003338C166